jgi:type I restriction-modification system DNA methylase subunit
MAKINDWDRYCEAIGRHLAENPDADYYFLVVNKSQPGDVFWTSLKRLPALTPNGNNPPFQCNWSKNRIRTERSHSEAQSYIKFRPSHSAACCFMSQKDVTRLGQVFTPPKVVEFMLALCGNRGRALEPSAGDGVFFELLKERHRDCVGIEIDPRVAPPGAEIRDFFDYPLTEQFETIVGNPPYVRFQDVAVDTRKRLKSGLFDARSNLFLFFIEKCVRHLKPGGELVFIVPREFIKLTAARKLNAWLFEQGSITHFYETGDTRVFGEHTPNCAIFRFEKGRMDRHAWPTAGASPRSMAS